MKHRCMTLAGHIFVLVLLAGAALRVRADWAGMSGYRLFLALAAMTVTAVNHGRWWALGREIEDARLLGRIDLLVVAHYCVLFFVFELLNLR